MENNNHPHLENSKYNLMFIWTPDTADRIQAVKNRLMNTLGEDIPVYIQPYKQFADGSWNVDIKHSVRGQHVYLYMDHFSDYSENGIAPDINSRYMLTQHMIDAINNSSPKTLNVIFPMFPFGRSDKNEDMGISNEPKRTPIMAAKVAKDLWSENVQYCITIDLHNPSIVWYFKPYNTRCINLWYGWLIKKAIALAGDQQNAEGWSTDLWGAKKSGKVWSKMQMNSFVGDKTRDYTIPNSVATIEIHKGKAKIEGKDAKTYDDMFDTWWTGEKYSEELSVYNPHSSDLIMTHLLANGEWRAVIKRLHEKGKLRTFYTTDSVYRTLAMPDNVVRIPTDEIIAETIESIVLKKPIQYNYIDEA